MRFEYLLIVLAVLVTLCVFLFVSVICIKLMQEHREREKARDTKEIKPVLKKLLALDTIDFFKDHAENVSKMTAKLNGKYSLQTLEDVLLDILDDTEGEINVRARAIAQYFQFPENSLAMIRDRLTGNIAIGCRKAGLYRYEDSVPDILKVLNIYSSEIQLQALMALARIGDAESMVKAFDQIHKLIFVNERAVTEMLNIFSGNRIELYKKMIFHQSEYLVRLFLKAIDKETAVALIDSIVTISNKSDKETRLACIVAIGKAGDNSKIPILISALTDKEWEVRAMAAKTLGVLTGPEAVLPLAGAARDREWWVRQNAVTSILAYPGREEILVSIAETGDKYAYDSMLFTLGKANETKLLSKIREVWPASGSEPKTRSLPSAPAAVSAKRGSGGSKRRNSEIDLIPVH